MQIFIRKYLDLVRQNEEMNDIIKTVKSLEESGLLIKCVNETIKNEAKKKKKKKVVFLSILLGTLGAGYSDIY